MRSAASLDTIASAPCIGLAEGGADDPVVGHRRVEAVLDEQVLLHAVDLDLQRAGRRAVADRHRLGERAAGVTRSSSIVRSAVRAGAADVVEPALQAVELLDDGQRDDDVDADEAGDARRVGDQHRGVEHDPSSHTPLDIDCDEHG